MISATGVRNILIIACLVAATQARGADEKEWLDTGGAGAASCAQFMAHPQFEDLFFSWAQGFMTGLNIRPDTRTNKNIWEQSSKLQKAEIYEYCRNHLTDSYMMAIFKMFENLPPVPYKSD
jgi:hypothetical protein